MTEFILSRQQYIKARLQARTKQLWWLITVISLAVFIFFIYVIDLPYQGQEAVYATINITVSSVVAVGLGVLLGFLLDREHKRAIFAWDTQYPECEQFTFQGNCDDKSFTLQNITTGSTTTLYGADIKDVSGTLNYVVVRWAQGLAVIPKNVKTNTLRYALQRLHYANHPISKVVGTIDISLCVLCSLSPLIYFIALIATRLKYYGTTIISAFDEYRYVFCIVAAVALVWGISLRLVKRRWKKNIIAGAMIMLLFVMGLPNDEPSRIVSIYRDQALDNYVAEQVKEIFGCDLPSSCATYTKFYLDDDYQTVVGTTTYTVVRDRDERNEFIKHLDRCEWWKNSRPTISALSYHLRYDYFAVYQSDDTDKLLICIAYDSQRGRLEIYSNYVFNGYLTSIQSN